MFFSKIIKYSEAVRFALDNAVFSSIDQKKIHCDYALVCIVDLFERARKQGRKVLFIGNGGSASIASHMAQDFTKIGSIRALCFNDASLLTCFANDFGFEKVFQKAIQYHADKGDLLVALSSSGASENIVNGLYAARERECDIITLTGFDSGNQVSLLGHINMRVPSRRYGIVETAHALFLHAILDTCFNEPPSP